MSRLFLTHTWLGFCLNLGWRYQKIIMKHVNDFRSCREYWFLYVKMVQGCTSGCPWAWCFKQLGRESTPILIYFIKCNFFLASLHFQCLVFFLNNSKLLIRWNKEKQKRLYEMSRKPQQQISIIQDVTKVSLFWLGTVSVGRKCVLHPSLGSGSWYQQYWV